MKRAWLSLAAILLSACMLLGALYGILTLQMYDLSFYEKEYAREGQAQWIGMSEEDLMKTTGVLLDYMQEKREDLVVRVTVRGQEREFFNEQEKLHMVDVNAILRGFDLFSLLAGCLFCAALFLFLWREKGGRLEFICASLWRAGALLLLLFGALGAWAALDFTSFWTVFHKIFFRNDLWLMDPSVSLMIHLFPENFFSDFVGEFLKKAALCVGLPLLGCFGLWLAARRKRRSGQN